MRFLWGVGEEFARQEFVVENSCRILRRHGGAKFEVFPFPRRLERLGVCHGQWSFGWPIVLVSKAIERVSLAVFIKILRI